MFTKTSPNYTIFSASFNKPYKVLPKEELGHLGGQGADSFFTEIDRWWLNRKWSSLQGNQKRKKEVTPTPQSKVIPGPDMFLPVSPTGRMVRMGRGKIHCKHGSLESCPALRPACGGSTRLEAVPIT